MYMNKCLNCQSKTKNPKFCCKSCSAIFNNLKRGCVWDKKHTIGKRGFLSKRHICGPHSPVYFRHCTNCQNIFASQKQKYPTTCSDKCFISIKKRNATGIKRKHYKGLKFDSGWEVLMAKLLDKHNINWTVPNQSIEWIDDIGKSHKYFPDFYLPNYNVYLDPKNPHVVKLTQRKLDILSDKIRLLYGEPSEIMERLTGLEPA